MNTSRYRKRLEADLDKWVDAGWVGEDSRKAILTSIREDAPSDRARSALLVAGAILLGLALIAFIASNWDGLGRLLKASVLLLALTGAVAGSLAARARGRARLAESLVLLAGLVFAASVGLMGQVLNMPGPASSAFMLASFGALLLGAAGASPWTVGLSLLFGVLWQMSALAEPTPGSIASSLRAWRTADFALPVLILLAAGLSRLWNSPLLRHLAIWSAGYSGGLILFKLITETEESDRIWLLVQALIWGLAALAGRSRYLKPAPGGSTLYGYGAWWGMLAVSGLSLTLSITPTWMGADIPTGIILLERAAWIGLSLFLIAIGQTDRHGWVIASGVVSLIGAISLLMSDLGLSLTAAAGVFLLTALIALGFALRMGRRSHADRSGS